MAFSRLAAIALASTLAACAKGSDAGFGGGDGFDPSTTTGAHRPSPESASSSTGRPLTSSSSFDPQTSVTSGGLGGASASSSTGDGTGAATSTTQASSTSVASSSSTGGTTGCLDHLVIGELRSRGVNGGSDEFISLYNPTTNDVTLDSNWTLQARAFGGSSYTGRWTGSGKTIRSGGYYLVAGTAYADSPAADDTMTGIKDASSVTLQQGSTVVDALCYTWDASQSYGSGFHCEGTPADNTPHDDSTAGNVDQSLLREQGGCADTGDNASDFKKQSPSTPKSTTTP